jgi:hypothetical protein
MLSVIVHVTVVESTSNIESLSGSQLVVVPGLELLAVGE